MRLTPFAVPLFLPALVVVGQAAAQARPELARQVFEAESSFAASMANRDLTEFGRYVASDAIFFGQGRLRGKAAVIDGWKGFFDGAAPPFSWQPEIVEVLESGELALSSGPVFAPDGRRIATFNSIWRREADGRWRVIFDKGAPVCPPAP